MASQFVIPNKATKNVVLPSDENQRLIVDLPEPLKKTLIILLSEQDTKFNESIKNLCIEHRAGKLYDISRYVIHYNRYMIGIENSFKSEQNIVVSVRCDCVEHFKLDGWNYSTDFICPFAQAAYDNLKDAGYCPSMHNGLNGYHKLICDLGYRESK